MNEEKTGFEGWCILELLGHRRLAGYVREVELAGVGMLRIDVPGEDGRPVATQFYGPSSLYALTPTTEEIARAVAARSRPEPVQRWELPAPAKPEEGQDTPSEVDEEAYDELYEQEENDDGSSF
jgi:hypothetical protein